MPRLNIFENRPKIHDGALATALSAANTLMIHHVGIQGSISFDNVALIKTIGNTANTVSISFGLYSLNGSSLSLANSASQTNTMQNGQSWVTLVTSATQDITPGDWFFGVVIETSSVNPSFICNNVGNNTLRRAYGGPFFRGWATASQTNMPASIATSDLGLEGSATGPLTSLIHPYILISA